VTTHIADSSTSLVGIIHMCRVRTLNNDSSLKIGVKCTWPLKLVAISLLQRYEAKKKRNIYPKQDLVLIRNL
jgi:hypothetical protein